MGNITIARQLKKNSLINLYASAILPSASIEQLKQTGIYFLAPKAELTSLSEMSVHNFIAHAVEGAIADPKGLFSWQTKTGTDDNTLLIYILLLTNLDIIQLPQDILNKDKLTSSFKTFKNTIKKLNLSVTMQEYKELIQCMFMQNLSLAKKRLYKPSKKTLEIINILKNQLKLSYPQQYEAILTGVRNRSLRGTLFETLPKGLMLNLTAEEERSIHATLEKSFATYNDDCWELTKGLDWYQRSNTTTLTPSKDSDIPLLSLSVRELIISSRISTDKLCIFFPDAFLVHNLIHSSTDISIIFIVESDSRKALLEHCIKEEGIRYASKYTLKTIDEFLKDEDYEATTGLLIADNNRLEHAYSTLNTMFNMSEKETINESLIAKFNRAIIMSELYVLSADSDVITAGTIPYMLVRSEYFKLQDLYLFPEEIKLTRPKLVSLMKFTRTNDDNVKTAVTKISRYEDNFVGLIFNKPNYNTVPISEIEKTTASGSLRTQLFATGRNTDNSERREKAEVDSTIKEVPVYYTQSDYSDHLRLRFYLKSLIQDDKHHTPTIIEGSVKINTKAKTPQGIHTEIVKYLQGKASPSLEFETTIRDLAIDHILPTFLRQPISLRALLYFYPKLESKMSSECYKLLAKASRNPIGSMPINLVTENDFYESLISLALSPRQKIILLIAYSTALNYACTKEHLSENPLKDITSNADKFNSVFNLIRSLMAKKVFTIAENRTIYDYIQSHIKSNPIYIALLIRFFTGLETNAVAALRWDNYHDSTEDVDAYISVFSQKTNDGAEERGFETLAGYRNIPLPDLVNDVLLKRRDYLRKTFNNTELKQMSLFYSPNTLDPSPIKIAKTARLVIDKLKIEDVNIEVPSYKSGTRKTNIAAYGGDIFRENFRHYAKRFGAFNDAELSIIFGTEPRETYANHYVDFQQDYGALDFLKVKLDRTANMMISKYSIDQDIETKSKVLKSIESDLVTSGLAPTTYIEVSAKDNFYAEISSKTGLYIYNLEDAE